MKKYWELFLIFFKIGAFTFGGGYAMIPLIEEEVSTKNKWLTDDEFLDALAIAQSLPGAVAINMSTYVGYRLNGIRGAAICCIGIIMPSFLIILSLAGFLIKYKDNHVLINIFRGVRPAIVSLIILSVLKLQKNVDKNFFNLGIFLIGFIMLVIFNLHPIVLIVMSGVFGYIHYGGADNGVR